MRHSHLVLSLCLSGCIVGDAPTSPTEPPPPRHDPEPTTKTLQSITGGGFASLIAGTQIPGRAVLVRRLDGWSELSIAVATGRPVTAFVAHVHAAPCVFGGGEHYKIDPAIATASEGNELWLRGQSAPTGALAIRASFAHVPRGSALSVVVHDPMGVKIACADLVEDQPALVALSGPVKPLPGVTGVDANLTGTADATTAGTGATFRLALAGLDPAAVGYETHIHAEPCEVGGGGGHYKLDPTVITAVETNEIWLPVTPTIAGTATVMLARPQPLRADAQSLVVHRVLGATAKPKIGCANLVRTTERAPRQMSGQAVPMPGVVETGLTGSAVMARKLTGVTTISVVASGLVPDAPYVAHLHDLPCEVAQGGGHYKRDPDAATTNVTNEVWFALVADADGAAYDSTWTDHVTSADAASLVLHAEGGARVGCFDLR